ncbi:hypothetical protein B0O80DRAFT_429766 [Mortierella sp. GBAus27b]|nr:hypothetical protein BGX31_009164 [Mortierella sp. GBA43]KAI8348239.1 hypothetical protein B0O80DRAFT_429766 [Mortierella sp. GBAus27b]
MSGLSVHVFAHGADHLKDVESGLFNKNDPYAQFTLTLDDKHSFKKTTVKKNAGKKVQWNEEVTLDNYDPSRHNLLFVDVLDEESTAPAVIGYAAIRLHVANDSPGRSFHGKFQLYDDDNKAKGFIHLTITITPTGQSAAHTGAVEQVGASEQTEEHKKHIKSLKRKEHAADGAKILGVLAAGYAAKEALSAHKEKKKEEKH